MIRLSELSPFPKSAMPPNKQEAGPELRQLVSEKGNDARLELNPNYPVNNARGKNNETISPTFAPVKRHLGGAAGA
jgi:hypothetical protein